MIRKLFAALCAAKTPATETPRGAIKTSEVNGWERLVLPCGSVAYVAHNQASINDAQLSVNNIAFVDTDRNTSEDYCEINVMTEAPDTQGLNDFTRRAEAENEEMEASPAATIVIFYHYRDNPVGDHDTIIKQIRQSYPATNPKLDEYLPQPLPIKHTPTALRPSTNPGDYGLCG